jgi:hypothetical protein
MKQRDIRFAILVGLNLVAIGGFMTSTINDEAAYTGWRRIDYQALLEKINSSDLVRHEALYWHEESSLKSR